MIHSKMNCSQLWTIYFVESGVKKAVIITGRIRVIRDDGKEAVIFLFVMKHQLEGWGRR